MGIKTVTVATCDGPEGREGCLRTGENPGAMFRANGRILCAHCLHVSLDYLTSGQIEGSLEVEKFDPDKVSNELLSTTASRNGTGELGMCYICKPPRGPYKALSAHQRKFHKKYVRGSRTVHEDSPDMPRIPFEAAEEAEREAEKRKLVDPDPKAVEGEEF